MYNTKEITATTIQRIPFWVIFDFTNCVNELNIEIRPERNSGIKRFSENGFENPDKIRMVKPAKVYTTVIQINPLKRGNLQSRLSTEVNITIR